jgi:hypothetical protein
VDRCFGTTEGFIGAKVTTMSTRPASHTSEHDARHHLNWRQQLAHLVGQSPRSDDLPARYKAEVDLLVEQIGRLQHLGLAIELARQRLHEGAAPATIDHLLAFALEYLGPDDLEPVVLDVLDPNETPTLNALKDMWSAPPGER